jgi:hypothetical protein
MKMETSKEDRILIAEMKLRQVVNSIYDLCITKRVLDKVGDKEQAEGIVKQLEKCEKMKDEYELIIKEEKASKK